MRIVAGFAYRYEPDWMIDQLRENLAWVDGFAEINTRGRGDVWMPRLERVRAVQQLARDMDADWVLALDPDERLEDGAEATLRKLADGRHGRYSLRMRELWTPTAYRIDGTWGNRRRRRFYRLGNRHQAQPIDINIYHLATIEPANRAVRRHVHTDHNTWDNKSHGFDYLDDDTGKILEEIPTGRGYTPTYRRYVKQIPGYQ
jgi:hypothetical protein